MDKVENYLNVSWGTVANISMIGAAVAIERGASLLPSWSAVGATTLAGVTAVCITRAVLNHKRAGQEVAFQKIIPGTIHTLLRVIQADDLDTDVWAKFTVPIDPSAEPLGPHAQVLYEGGQFDVANLLPVERQQLLFGLISRLKGGVLNREDLQAGSKRGVLLRAILNFIRAVPAEKQSHAIRQFGHLIGPYEDRVLDLLIIDV